MILEQRKTTFQIVCLCIGFLGLQIGFALQAGNITRILHNYGANLDQIAYFWLIAPLTGTFIQPVIGHLSDQWIKKGKTRTPFLLLGGLLSTLTLVALPNAELFITLLSPLVFSALFIFIADVAFNATLHPLRTTITDYLPASQQNSGFTIQTFLISLGAILGSSLPYLLQQYTHIGNSLTESIIPDNVKYAFYIGAIILLVTILLNSHSILRQKTPSSTHSHSVTLDAVQQTSFFQMLINLPGQIWKIGLIQFFSWISFFLLWVYMTPALAQHYYHQPLYDGQTIVNEKAGNFTGVLFAYYHLAAGLYALALPFLFKRWNVLTIHGFSLTLGAIGFLWVFIAQNPDNLYIPMLCIGIAWSSILASPFILLSQITPKNQVGFYFGLFNIFITLPQIIIGLGSGYIISFLFDNKAIYAILLAAVAISIASGLSFYFKTNFMKKKYERPTSS